MTRSQRHGVRPRPQNRAARQWGVLWWIGGGAAVIVAVVVIAVVAARSSDDSDTASPSSGVTGPDFHSLVADPVTPERLYVGGHEAVSMSTDGGAVWQRLRALDDADAMGWAFTSDGTWVSGHPGIMFTADGAATAQGLNDALPDTDIHAFGSGGELLYAAGPNVGVLTSNDGADSWQTVTTSDGQAFFGRILVDPEKPGHLIAADAASGPVSSDDTGRTWTVLTEFPTTWVAATPKFDVLYASGPDGAVTSGDGGVTWESLSLPPGATLVEVDPHRAGRLYTGVHDGTAVTVYVSDDNGRSWRRA